MAFKTSTCHCLHYVNSLTQLHRLTTNLSRDASYATKIHGSRSLQAENLWGTFGSGTGQDQPKPWQPHPSLVDIHLLLAQFQWFNIPFKANFRKTGVSRAENTIVYLEWGKQLPYITPTSVWSCRSLTHTPQPPSWKYWQSSTDHGVLKRMSMYFQIPLYWYCCIPD